MASDHENDDAPRAQEESEGARRGPDAIAYTVRDRGEGKDSVWNRIGAAWNHRDGQGRDIQLDAIPVDGRITLRDIDKEAFKEKRAAGRKTDREHPRER